MSNKEAEVEYSEKNFMSVFTFIKEETEEFFLRKNLNYVEECE